ncbi:M15 family metallopeptidase [Peribacillus butanolivorans]|uniref:M15 family metallopeptidase n=1 Tax=Peribacillus butanolivorans TaxID=421767 RepID=UPI003805F90C
MTVKLESLIDRSITNMRDGINPTVKESALELIKRAYDENIYVQITSGYRGMEEQAALYGQGRETYVYNGKDYGDPTMPIVTNAKPGQSNHNFGTAIDFVLMNDDGDRVIWDVNEKWKRVAEIGKELCFKWGGDWTSFKDYPHLEMKDLNPNSSRPMLHVGDTGEFVKQLQEALTRAGFFTGLCDGVLGEMTKQALINFQEANNLSADGVAGLMTWEALDMY